MTDMDHRPTTKLARRYSWQTLLAFTVPSVLMQVGFSLTTTGDSMISSRMISTTALAAVSICIPLIYVEDALAAMFGAGGCAVIGRLLGEGRIDRARSALSDLVIFAVAAGLVWAGLIYGLRAPLLHLLGANDELFPLSMQYLELHARFAALFVLQRMFALLLIVAGMAGPEFGQAVLKVACNHGLTCGFAGVAGWIWSLKNGCARPVGWVSEQVRCAGAFGVWGGDGPGRGEGGLSSRVSNPRGLSPYGRGFGGVVGAGRATASSRPGGVRPGGGGPLGVHGGCRGLDEAAGGRAWGAASGTACVFGGVERGGGGPAGARLVAGAH